MQSRGPVWWLLYGAGAIIAFMLGGRLVALIFGSFFSLLIVEEHLDRAAISNGQYTANADDNGQGILRAVVAPDEIGRAQQEAEESFEPTLPGGVRPLTEADLQGAVPPYLETPSGRRAAKR